MVVASLNNEDKLGLAAKLTQTQDGSTTAIEAYIPYDNYVYFGGKVNYGGQSMDMKYKMDISEYMRDINNGIQELLEADYDEVFGEVSSALNFNAGFNMGEILADFTISKSVKGSVTKYKFTSEEGLEYDGVTFENPVIYLIFNNGEFAGVAVEGTVVLDIEEEGVTQTSGTITFKASLAPYASAISFPDFTDYQDLGNIFGGNGYNYNYSGNVSYNF